MHFLYGTQHSASLIAFSVETVQVTRDVPQVKFLTVNYAADPIYSHLFIKNKKLYSSTA